MPEANLDPDQLLQSGIMLIACSACDD